MEIITLFTALLSLGLAFFFLLQNLSQRINWLLFALFVTFLIREWGLWQLWHVPSYDQALLWAQVLQVGICLAPFFAFLMILCWRGPESRPLSVRLRRFLVLYSLAPLILIVSLFLFPFIKELEGLQPPLSIRYGPLGYAFLVYYLLAVLLLAALVENILEKPSPQLIRLRYPLIILLGWFITQLLFLHSQILVRGTISPGVILASSPILLLIELSFTYFTVRYGLLQINIRFSQELTIRSASGVIVMVYLAIVLVSFRLGEYFLSFPALLATLFTLTTLIILVFVHPIWRSKLKEFLLLHLYRSKYDFRQQLSNLLGLIQEGEDLERLLDKILNFCLQQLGSQGGVIHLGFRGRSITLVKGYDDPAQAMHLVRTLGEPDRLQGVLDLRYWAVLRPFQGAEGFLGLQGKISGQDYDGEDIYFLNTFCLIFNYLISHVQQTVDRLAYREWEVMNQLSTFVIHDLKNTAYFLSLSLKNAAQCLEREEFRRDFLQDLERSIREMEELIDRLTSLRQKREIKRERMELNKFLEERVELLQERLGEGIRFRLELGPLPPLELDKEGMERVLYNLCLNAAEAMGGEGTISIKTYQHNGEVRWEIADTGQGMDQDFIRSRLFQPFQTTKPRGLGIGLYQCKQIIEGHGGKIEVRSQIGQGTTFTISLPADGVEEG